mmetsp:Transcript_19852/g.25732  ORF Transcript_19852/g.25732 Transcript_19852/m.25732 type:complete len:569 (-) Transcript_19852:286-1992(-)
MLQSFEGKIESTKVCLFLNLHLPVGNFEIDFTSSADCYKQQLKTVVESSGVTMARLTISDEDRERLKTVEVEERVNPFTYEPNLTLWEVIKLILGIVTVPVKIVVIVACMFFAYLCAKLVILGIKDTSTKPLPWYRTVFFYPAYISNRIICLMFGIVWIEKSGKVAKYKDAPIVVCAPHSTVMDTFVSLQVIGRFSGYGKAEVAKTPFFGTYTKALQTILVDRSSAEAKAASLKELDRRMGMEGANWPKFLVFPEGTCTNRKALIQFKRGAFMPGKPVQLVTFEWPYRYFDPTWTRGTNRNWQLFRLLTQFITRVKVHCHEVHVPTEEEVSDPILFASNVRLVASDYLDIPVTAHSYEDSFLSSAALKAKFNPNDIVDFEFASLKKLFQMDLKEAKRMLKKFGKDKKVKKTGVMNVKQFAKALDVPLSEPVQEIFGLLDKEGTGFIDFKSFLVGLTFISQNTSIEDGVELLYEALDPEGVGRIDVESLFRVMSNVFTSAKKKQAKALINQADPEGTGFVSKERFMEFISENPEMLVAGLTIKAAYKDAGAPLSVSVTVNDSPQGEASL